MMMRILSIALLAFATALRPAFPQAVIPGDVTDPTAGKDRPTAKKAAVRTPDEFQYPYISTYYVKPTVQPSSEVTVGVFITDFFSSKVRFGDDSHRFTAYLEYRQKDGASRVLTLKDVKSGDSTFRLGRLPVGEYELRVWATDAKGRESHRVIHDFRVVDPASSAIPADRIYRMTAADLAAYRIRNDGDIERVVTVGADGKTEVIRERRDDVPGYTVKVPLDPKTGKIPVKAFKVATVDYDEGYDVQAVEADAVRTLQGLQRLLDEKSAAGFRKVVLLPGTYRLSWTGSVFVPDRMTLDLGGATLKQNAFTGSKSVLVRLSSVTDAHLVGGTLEGDYWTHDYAGSPNGSEWPAGFEIGGDSRYCSVRGVKVVDITGYGGQNGICKDAKGGHCFFCEKLPPFEADGLRFTTDFKDIRPIVEKGARRLQVSRYLGYQGCAGPSWQVTVSWYDADRGLLSKETAWQYRETWIPPGAAFLRVTIEAESIEAANESGLRLTAFRIPVNCAVLHCTFDHCRCVGYAASAMKNMLFAGNFFTRSGESAAKCAFDAEDGWDQMQDVYFFKNVFRENPFNNSILTCAGHNFILEQNEGDVYFWGRTHSPCVRGNAIGFGTYKCDSRRRSGYARLDGNTYSSGVRLGFDDGTHWTGDWDHVISDLDAEQGKGRIKIEVGRAGRLGTKRK